MKLEVYKCAMLTIIAGLLIFLAWKVQTKRISVTVDGGSIDVENTVDVDVGNEVKLDQPIEVTGSVEIER
jgi:hypothetical protein